MIMGIAILFSIKFLFYIIVVTLQIFNYILFNNAKDLVDICGPMTWLIYAIADQPHFLLLIMTITFHFR